MIVTRLQEITVEIGQRELRIEELYKISPLDWTDKQLRECLEEERIVSELRREQKLILRQEEKEYCEKEIQKLEDLGHHNWSEIDFDCYMNLQRTLIRLKEE